MGIMGYLRNRAGLLIFLIGLAIVAFLLGDVINYGTPFWSRNQNAVGSINGNSIDYTEFNSQVDQTVSMYQNQMGGGSANAQMRSFAVEQVWDQYISQELLKEEIKKIGLNVSKDELNDMVHGSNPSMQITQAFTNPETGEFDRNFLNQFLEQVKSGQVDPQMNQQWEMLLDNVLNEKQSEKYSNLLNNSLYITALEVKDKYESENKLANFNYLVLDYGSVEDSEIEINDADYKAYYDEHKKEFLNKEETRSLEYIVFDARPSAADTSAAFTNIENLKKELIESTDDSLFVSIHSETKYPVKYYSKNELNSGLDTLLFNREEGETVGPILNEGAYQIAKVMDTKFSPDSVQASHILLDATKEGGLDKATAKADSIKKLIEGGDSFSALAVEFSVDEQSKINGGDLGTFPRGQMIPEFEEAVFEGKAGDVITVNSQYGVHIIRIEKQIGNSKIVKAAIVDFPIHSSKETTNDAYKKANNFFSALNEDNFVEEADKQDLELQKVENTNAMASQYNSTEIPRDLARWAFEAKEGAVSDKVYESEDAFIVARLVGIQKKGQLPLEAVKKRIDSKVKNEARAKILKEKINKAIDEGSSLEAAAKKLGKSIANVEEASFANPVIPGVSQEPAVIGTVFGLQPNTPSKAIKGETGVYAVEVESFVNPDKLIESEIKTQRDIQLSAYQQAAFSAIFEALKGEAKIDDNRIRFY